MNVAFALIPEKGHINPYIGPAQALQARGHHVTVLSPGDITTQMQAAGLDFSPDLIPAAASSRPTHGSELVELIQDSARLAGWIEQLLLGDIPSQVALLRASLRRLAPDVVVIDPLYYAAAIAAHLESLPWVSVSNSLNPVLPPDLDSALLRTTLALGARRNAIFAGYGLSARFAGADVLSPHLNVAFTTAALCGPIHGVELVGPSFPLRERGDEVPLLPLPADRHIIYASFGSQIYHWPHIFAKIRTAAQALNAHLVLAAGDLVDQIEPDPHCQIYRYAPQQELLRHARVFITHGGANSFMEAITAGVPMLLSPMCNDQFHQAYFLERRGIGLAVDLRTMPVPALTAALAELLADGLQRRAMAELAQTYQVNGAESAAEAIERLGR